MWKIVMVIFFGLVGWVGLTMALTPTPQPNGGSTPIWIDMTPTYAYFQSTATQDMINEILNRATFWSGPGWQDPQNQAVVVADYTTTETPEQVLSAFQSALSTGDWQMIQAEGGDSAGLADAEATARFCYLQGRGTLNLTVTASAGTTKVSLLANFPGRHYRCGDVTVGPNINLPTSYTLPQLIVPAGVSIISQAKNDLENGILHSTHEDGLLIYTALSLEEVVIAYREQLIAAGWQPVLEEVGPTAAMSAWTVPQQGAVWTGTMVFMADGQQGYYRVHLAMEPRP